MRFIMMVAMVLAAAGLAAIAFRPRIARAAMLPEGAAAPDFHSQMVNGDQVAPISLADFHGHKLVLYFYPKDNTPGCTKEACAFRDGYARFQAAGISVLGCSIDSADSHKEFIRKYGLPFPLLLDPDKQHRERLWRRQRHSDSRPRPPRNLRDRRERTHPESLSVGRPRRPRQSDHP